MAKATESWADWILSSYSESISPPPAEAPPSPSPDSDSSDVSPDTTASPWGPYTKTGRGGAGNFQWYSSSDAARQHQRHRPSRDQDSYNTNDDEPQNHYDRRQHGHPPPPLRTRPTTIVQTDRAALAGALPSRKRPANIVTGRGGAGNLAPAIYAGASTPRSPSWPISPSSPAPATTPRTASSANTGTAPSTTSAATVNAVYGRGGAANFTASSLALSQARDEKLDEERRRADDLREQAEHDVEVMLKPPEDAFLVGARRREVGLALTLL